MTYQADLIDISEEIEEARETAKETAHQEDGQTTIEIKNLDSEIEETLYTDTATFSPEEEN